MCVCVCVCVCVCACVICYISKNRVMNVSDRVYIKDGITWAYYPRCLLSLMNA